MSHCTMGATLTPISNESHDLGQVTCIFWPSVSSPVKYPALTLGHSPHARGCTGALREYPLRYS